MSFVPPYMPKSIAETYDLSGMIESKIPCLIVGGDYGGTILNVIDAAELDTVNGGKIPIYYYVGFAIATNYPKDFAERLVSWVGNMIPEMTQGWIKRDFAAHVLANLARNREVPTFLSQKVLHRYSKIVASLHD